MRNSENPKNPSANHQGKCSRAEAVARIRHAIDDVTAARLLGCEPTDPQAAPTVRPQATELERRLLATIPCNAKAQAVAERALSKPVEAMWDLLRHRNGMRLAMTLKFEYPTAVAVILSRLTVPQAAEILVFLPDSFAKEVIMRLLTREKSKAKIPACSVLLDFKQQLMIGFSVPDDFDPIESTVSIFLCFESYAEHRFMAAMEERNRDLAEALKIKMYFFDFFARLSPADAGQVLQSVAPEVLTTALVGAPPAVLNAFLEGMTAPHRQAQIDKIGCFRDVDKKQILDAQRDLVIFTRNLIDKGIITDHSCDNYFYG